MSESPPLSEVVERVRTLPSAPWLLPKLIKLLGNPDAGADDVEALIRLDSALAGGTLRLANSAYFHSSAGCDSLTDAIVRLGFGEIYRLATTTVASRWLAKEVSGYGWEPGDLYRHSLTVAVAADLLAKETGRANAEIAYTAGLLHDVGKLALAFACAEHFDRVRERQRNDGGAWRAAEQAVLGYDHTDIAGVLLQAWAFPANLIEVAHFYSRPQLAAPEHRALVTHIHAAKHLAICIGTGVGEDGFQSELDEGFLKAEGITPDMIEALLPSVVERSAQLLRHETKT